MRVDGEELLDSDVWLNRRLATGIRECEVDLVREVIEDGEGSAAELAIIPIFKRVGFGVAAGDWIPRSLRDLRWDKDGRRAKLAVSKEGG